MSTPSLSACPLRVCARMCVSVCACSHECLRAFIRKTTFQMNVCAAIVANEKQTFLIARTGKFDFPKMKATDYVTTSTVLHNPQSFRWLSTVTDAVVVNS